ncbi:hypothetical protein BYT27DRAFT_7062538, partial [Phlegmacium glaucopus]
KFMPQFDGLYGILEARPDSSNYTLQLPTSTNIFPTFHASHLKPFIPNDDKLFPTCKRQEPAPI